MALKPDRIDDPYGQVIDYVFDATCERGGIASIKTGASTGYPGDTANVAQYAADCTLVKPIGMMLYDVVSLDTNRLHDNWYKSGFQARVNMKVCINRKGQWHTNMIKSGDTPAAGDPAYLYDNGQVSNTVTTRSTKNSPQVGYFKTAKDSDGYAVVVVEL